MQFAEKTHYLEPISLFRHFIKQLSSYFFGAKVTVIIWLLHIRTWIISGNNYMIPYVNFKNKGFCNFLRMDFAMDLT